MSLAAGFQFINSPVWGNTLFYVLYRPIYIGMSSPARLPFEHIVSIDRDSSTAVYLQIARQLTNAIKQGHLVPGSRLPGSRALSLELKVHRKTVVAAYGELEAQGWIEVSPNRGAYINNIPEQNDPFSSRFGQAPIAFASQTGYTFRRSILLDKPQEPNPGWLAFSDGMPDVRLTPTERLTRTYSGIMKRKNNRKYLAYSAVEGNVFYREILAEYLNNTRGLHITKDNILTTRGTQMAIFLTSALLLTPGDLVIVARLGFYESNMIFQHFGASLMQVPVDQDGISVDAIARLCKVNRIRMVYVTPSHHYPTGVTLSEQRRRELLELSEKYGFIILEDNYEHDFHYEGGLPLPIASADQSGMTIHIGSFCKVLAPGLRMGYLVAPPNLIDELGRLRQIVDRQGDATMEQTVAELLAEGEIQRQLKKNQRVYQERRDAFCSLLQSKLNGHVKFASPPGGLSVWTEWDKTLNLMRISKQCMRQGLYLPQTLLYQNESVTAMKLGFADLDSNEMEEAVTLLAIVVNESAL
ncbi:GntR family transcriptional regulator/MocR family aminotransferase [Arcticibacter tournemirensis]|nr:GntR family transcriptional regulator/MocR family aminotransferase [Arcticibacter tournemirensis]